MHVRQSCFAILAYKTVQNQLFTLCNYPDSHHSLGGMKFATQISPLPNYFILHRCLQSQPWHSTRLHGISLPSWQVYFQQFHFMITKIMWCSYFFHSCLRSQPWHPASLYGMPLPSWWLISMSRLFLTTLWN